MSRLAAVALAVLASGCLMPRYLSQAAGGQLDLLTRARPIDEVVRDPDVPLAVRELLAEIPAIKQWALAAGLTITDNYDTYVDLGLKDYVVYFVGAAPPLSFAARRWCFPIAGCFTGLGWFDEDDAIRHREQLRAEGWDAMARPAHAYSTGGWFPDPLLSTMLPDGDPATPDEATGYADLANVFLHESVHATVLVPDQMYFNEGIAQYVGDALTAELLDHRFGPGSAQRATWEEVEAWRRARTARELEAYTALEALYASAAPDADKLARKAEILEALRADLGLRRRPNNADLVEVRLYQASYDGFREVAAACGGPIPLLAAAKAIRRDDFTEVLQEDLTPVLAKIRATCANRARKTGTR